MEAGFPDDLYQEKGATIAGSRDDVFSADILLQVRSLGANPEHGQADLDKLKSGGVVIGLCDPLGNPAASNHLAEKQVTQFALELIPRITRAQSMDVLSSMATIAGYRAVLLAAQNLPKMFPLMMTAAGTLSPARVFVIGAGVAGLQAIATSRRLGAVVQAYDVRPAVREQVESLGAKFVELELDAGQSEDKGGYAKAMGEEFYTKQREFMAQIISECDVVISTAAIPGRDSPLLITEEAVIGMPPGGVIVDLAAERGGNCKLSEPEKSVRHHGITILGPTNLPAEIPQHASQMYANNLCTFLKLLIKDDQVNVDRSDEVIRDTLMTHDGEVANNRIREMLGMEPLIDEPEPATASDVQEASS